MNKPKDDRRRRALARLEKRLAPTLTIPLSPEQSKLWEQVIILRRSLGSLTDADLAIERSLKGSP